MSQKRKGHPSPPGNAKRPRYNNADVDAESNPASKAPVDPTYGQRSAFPGLDDNESDDGLFYGPASDGFEYLRMVRSEARGVPNLLTAPKSETQEDDELYQDYPQGYYADGAYTAAPIPKAQPYGDFRREHDVDPQEAYYTALLDRFQRLGTLLQSSSLYFPQTSFSTGSIAATAAKLTNAPSKSWRVTLLYTQPTTQLLGHLDQDTVVAGIAALEKYISWSDLRKSRYLGAWAWGLLAKCREVGMMGSEEVAILRDLGKRAREMVREVEVGSEIKEKGMSDDGVEDSSDVDEQKYGGGGNQDLVDEDVVSEDSGEGSVKPSGLANETSDANRDASTPQRALENTESGQQASTTVDEDISQAKERLLTAIQGPEISGPVSPSMDKASTDRAGLLPSQRNHSLHSQPLISPPAQIGSVKQEVDSSSAATADQLTDRVAAIPDMLVTIIGEKFGQRDLLDGRVVWA
ncbi:MAG: hypothetical protein Q9222_004075 [Ikaeria aurantiellina]